ncbi:hypothetical protein [Legionella jordanis]|uniref:Uncharacterized protein n=1 Tax=Legionella jordanis TaxID=456 RepID=A0A0W0VBE1_9GAMM|nr:hypothetical protein [Legionella jordanis]KTD17400.1 hypothetical protein Ljor_1706 [Legionella jordanis]RMX01834.1 hypothetical protein EAW55_10025 [Legionella jordanis]RMX15498.1 hypothetical protein EAS68_12485 [Legionella jordanis]VEH11579.1 Uncharacterised protein [Legionella jordanis]HAT8714653.1 hypothetical protein [Legionella jordanis]
MNAETNSPSAETLTLEHYSKAMNFIGHNLLAALSQSVEKLPAQLRDNKVVFQGLSAFLANVIHKQFPKNPEFGYEVLDELNKLVKAQLDKLLHPSE